MRKLLNWLFGSKTKDGRCRSWNHKWDEGKVRTYQAGTNRYIGDEEITRKVTYVIYHCTKCNDSYTI